jgi:hypothetical protein
MACWGRPAGRSVGRSAGRSVGLLGLVGVVRLRPSRIVIARCGHGAADVRFLHRLRRSWGFRRFPRDRQVAGHHASAIVTPVRVLMITS